MNKRIGLYWQHDLDLVALKMHPDFNIGYWMKRAVIAYARGDEGFVIPLPREMPYRVEIDNCSTHFVLHPEKEADVIACLNGFRTGHVANAIKQIFRMYLEAPYLAPYYNDQMFDVKTRGRAQSSNGGTTNVKPIVKRRVPQAKSEVPKMETPRAEISKPVTETPKPVVETSKHYEEKEVSKTVTEQYNEPLEEKTQNYSTYNETPNYNAPSEPEQPSEDEDDGFDMFAAIDKLMG